MSGAPGPLQTGPLRAARPRSLRRRLLLWVSLATLLIYVLAAALTYRQARHEVQELMDGQMAKTARLLLAQAPGESAQLAGLAEGMLAVRGARSRRSELALEFVLARSDGGVLSRSAQAPDVAVDGALGFATIAHRGQPWRSLTLASGDDRYRVLVAQSIVERDREALEIATKTVLPLGVLLPLLIALIYYSVRRGLKPLDDLAGEVSTRTPENLTPLRPAAEMQETQPLVRAVNQLLDRLATTLDNERRFTADAAHELRTPLAALKIHAQVALATNEPAQCRQAVAKVIAGADRATRLVEQLLRLARLDPLLSLPDPQPLDLAELAAAVCDEASPAAAVRRQRLICEAADGPVAVRGDRDLLTAAIRNLVDNALRYSADGGEVRVRAAVAHGEPCLAVSDNGPGVPAEELPRLVERFYRGRDNTAEGSGLGLAIVRRIAELHRARLEVANAEGGGFTATLRWCGGDAERRAA